MRFCRISLVSLVLFFTFGNILQAACAEPIDHKQQQEQAGPLIIAHRGASFDAPENTIAAFEEAWKQGADGIEADFRLTSDGRVVCIHDNTTKRCGDQNLAVGKSTLDQLRHVDVGSWKHARYKAERIPTLEEVLSHVPQDKRIFVELKDGKQIVEPTRKAILDSGIKPSQVMIISFHADVIVSCRETMPNIQASWLTSCKVKDGKLIPSEAELVQKLRSIDANGVGVKADRSFLNRSFVESMHEHGLHLNCWTVNSENDARRFSEAGVDSITTDKPGPIIAALKKAERAER